jgi:hypothetical protein
MSEYLNGESTEVKSNQTEQLVHWVVILTRPDYKFSKVYTTFQTSTLNEYKKKIFNKIYRYIFNMYLSFYEKNELTLNIINNIYIGKAADYPMDNNSWTAKALINGEWVDSNPTHKQILEQFIKDKKNDIEEYSDDEDDEAEDDESEDGDDEDGDDEDGDDEADDDNSDDEEGEPTSCQFCAGDFGHKKIIGNNGKFYCCDECMDNDGGCCCDDDSDDEDDDDEDEAEAEDN